MPIQSKLAKPETRVSASSNKAKENPKRTLSTSRAANENDSHASHKPRASGSKNDAFHDATNQSTLGKNKRQRKPTEKIVLQSAQQEADEKERLAQANRKAQRAQRDAPDTEDEDQDKDQDFDEDQEDEEDELDDEDDEPLENTFSSRIVETRLSPKSDQAPRKQPTLVRSIGRVPVSKANVQDQDDDAPRKNPTLVRSIGRVPVSKANIQDQDDDDNAGGNIDDSSPLKDRDSSKRRRSESTDSIDAVREVKACKHTTGQRPKTSDFDDLTKECIIVAIAVYRCFISAIDPFPDHATERGLGMDAWAIATVDLRCHDLPLTAKVSKLITNRASHLRGELKTKARPIVETYYNFESGNHKKTITENRRIAENLKDGYGYAYKLSHEDHKQRRGLYRTPLIQKIVNVMWFCNRQDEGVTHDKYFHPIKPETVALVLTVIDCCIDEWMTGIRTDCAFTAAAYHDTYTEHMRCIEDFESHDKEKGNRRIFENICEKLYNRGRFHAGAQPISQVKIRTIPTAAFDAAIQEYDEDDKTETDGESGDLTDA